MKYGVSIIPNTGIMAITELAVAVEERGLDALFMGEHIHIPVKPRIAYPLPTMSAEYGRGGRRNPAHQAGLRNSTWSWRRAAASLSVWVPDGCPRSRPTAPPSQSDGRSSRNGSKR